MKRCFIVSFFFFSLLSCSNPIDTDKKTLDASQYQQSKQEYLYFISGDSLFQMNLKNKHSTFLVILSSNWYGNPSIDPDGKNILYCKRDTSDKNNINKYEIYCMNLSTKQEILIDKAYSGKWNHKGNKFLTFKEDTLRLYEYPSLKRISQIVPFNNYRWCALDWTFSDQYVLIYGYNKDTLEKSKLIVIDSSLTKITQVFSINGILSKQLINVNDTLFLFAVQCFIHKNKGNLFHLAKWDNFLHTLKCDTFFILMNSEDLAYAKSTQNVIFNLKLQGTVLSSFEYHPFTLRTLPSKICNIVYKNE